jgi:hypothetical protein
MSAMVPATPRSPPPSRASVWAQSFPELRNRPNHSVSTVYCPLRTSPTAELPGSKFRSDGVMVMGWVGSSFGSTVSASSSFCTLAGAA